jgi:O-antigen biosynthesis protein WbqP
MYKIIKWLLDKTLALFLLIILFPVFIIIGILIKITSKGQIIFKQERVGKNKKHFMMYKFRTMKLNTPSDKPTNLLNESNKYITKIGKFLRKTSLDELPQLINILFNQMSFIGPRPVLYTEIELIEEREKYFANSVYPGLTGLAQVNGRDTLNYKEKAKFDGIYANKITFLLDLKIFIKTIKIVLTKEGIIEGDSNNK